MRKRSRLFGTAALAAFVLLGFSVTGHATCRDYSDLFRITGSCPVGSSGGAVALSGNRAYLVGSFISVVDISSPTGPVVVGSGGADGYDICVSGNYAYLARGTLGVCIEDISNPAAISFVGFAPAPYGGFIKTVSLSGSLLCATDATTWGRFDVYNVADPSAPACIGTIELNTPSWVRCAGSLAYVTAGTNGLYVIDLTTPTAPAIIGQVDTPGNATCVALDGSCAWVVDGDALQGVDVTNPHAPVLRGRALLGGTGLRVSVRGGIACVALSDASELRTLDVSNPDAPRLVNMLGVGLNPRAIVMDATHVYVSGADDDYYQSEFQAVDLAHALEPSTLDAALGMPDRVTSVAWRDGYAYLAADEAGLVVVNAGDPLHPVIAGICDTPRNAYSVCLHGNQACVADGSSGLALIDISNPAAPFITSRLDAIYAATVGTGTNVAFVGDDTNLMRVVNISNPAAPTLVNSVWATSYPGQLYDFLADGNRLYVAAGRYGLDVFDITTESSPVFLGHVTTPGVAYAVTGSAPYLFVATGTAGVSVVDVSVPASPVVRTTVWAPSTICDLALDGTRLFAAGGNSGVQVFDVTNPLAPVVIGSHEGPDYTWSCAFGNHHLFAAAGTGGLTVYPENCFAPAGTASVAGSAPGNVRVCSAHPNPFTSETHIDYALTTGAPVRITIHDVQGRLVRDLSSRAASGPGTRQVAWDGTTESGSAAAPGIYFAHVSAGAESETARLLLVR